MSPKVPVLTCRIFAAEFEFAFLVPLRVFAEYVETGDLAWGGVGCPL